jgi:hypothetical protein
MASRGAILVRSWLTLGVVDGISAVLISRARSSTATIAKTFQGVAYALLGKDAQTGGTPAALLGIAMHFVVAFSWVAVYFGAYSALPALRRITLRPLGIALVGMPLGAFIWFFMNVVVFPLTRIAGHAPFNSPFFLTHLVHHTLVVGPLVAWLVRWRGDSARTSA